MAFRSNIDYVGHQRVRQRGIEGVTRAKLETKLRAEAEARRQAAINASKKKKSSMGRKIIGAVARGAAAYYTAGASEASGLGGMIDQQIQGGSDYERNEYGDMVGAVSSMSGMMTAKTANAASARLNAQSARDDAMQERMDKISPRAGMKFAEERAAKDAKNREVFNDYKSGFLNFGKDIDGLDLDATVIDYSGIKKDNKIEATTPALVDTSPTSSYSSLNQLSTLKPSATTDSGGLSTKLTEHQADLFRGPKEPESPDPVKFNQSGTGTDEPVQSEPAKLETIDDQMAHFRD